MDRLAFARSRPYNRPSMGSGLWKRSAERGWMSLSLRTIVWGLTCLLLLTGGGDSAEPAPILVASQTGSSGSGKSSQRPGDFQSQTPGIVAAGDSPDLTLHFTAEVMGWMEPCG